MTILQQKLNLQKPLVTAILADSDLRKASVTPILQKFNLQQPLVKAIMADSDLQKAVVPAISQKLNLHKPLVTTIMTDSDLLKALVLHYCFVDLKTVWTVFGATFGTIVHPFGQYLGRLLGQLFINSDGLWRGFLETAGAHLQTLFSSLKRF